ncbi:uncharacterized protein Z518_10594 [Rhinocladiella mackenziei CBS 650.93]|uniref:Spc7 kinetochore protein domain-containing protein n=1 Tax=Rhinocladiella mackenziei CBS 650.93 TaxID=1442369 RepID=A0A0D2I3V8_9EURO|nr:uncharacterized protein Z518_10594 [Rhinocladiella mackenziei CBS 650.93]KIX00454.1 hypothetical protein Z518_10594 [Rhinocladiella mackenziei CBS 650.93]
MADSTADQRSRRPKARQSIAHLPSTRTSVSRDNATTDITALQVQNNTTQAAKKKSRGKSLGPGGLEALKEPPGNSTKVFATFVVSEKRIADHWWTTTPFQIKSILKPTILLTPPKVIPTFDELRKRSTEKDGSPGKNSAEELLIDFSTPGPNKPDGGDISTSSADNAADPFSPITRRSPRRPGVGGNPEDLRREQEEEFKRQAEKKAVLERRAARRKSLANRRVSFAPEATLHTWSVMELVEDSTTSSASNSTRRQSSMTTAQSPDQTPRSPETPAIPSALAEQTEDPLVKASPEHQRDVHQQKRRRRSSGLSEVMLDAAPDEAFSSSPSGDVTTNSSPLRVEEGIESSDESDTDGDTAMSLDESTAHTINSQDSASSTHSSLDERLRQAADQAGTRGIEYDEHGDDLSMEMVTGTVTNAFQLWAPNRAENADNGAVYDQENVNPFTSYQQESNSQQIQDPGIEDEAQDETQEMSMDVTKAVGGIVYGQSPGKKGRKSPVPRRRSSIRRRRSSGDGSALDESMEFTVMQGGILGAGAEPTEATHTHSSDEYMTMEFTKAGGRILDGSSRCESALSEQTDENESMDMTTAAGGILPPIEEQTEPQTDMEEGQTMALEMTKAAGGILNQNSASEKRMTREPREKAVAFTPDSKSPHVQAIEQTTSRSAPKSTPRSQHHRASVASETGSPSLALKPRLSGRPQRNAPKPSSTPQSKPPSSPPIQSAVRVQTGTPSKQTTPFPTRAETPNKTPPSVNVAHRGASAKKLFKAEIKARNSPGSTKREANLKANSLFSRDAETGQHTPSVILRAPKPRVVRRRSSGIGIDKDGIGSPRAAELLDRRTSIGEVAPQFKLGDNEPGQLRFEDPQQLEHEVEVERVDEHRRESGRFIMEQEADENQDENATLQLRDMIVAMSPEKPRPGKLRGRKSLAIGGARGLLGKRPAELDMDDEDEHDSTPKRLKAVSREGSPVKRVHLPKPPTKDETTGRLSTKLQESLQEMVGVDKVTPTIGTSSPSRSAAAPSPPTTGRFKDVETSNEARPTSFEDRLDNVVGAIDVSTAQMQSGTSQNEREKISLQQFLNMTNIHFIELSTTKRRHTIAQSLPIKESVEGAHSNGTKANFVAAATTLPLLELYQHATRELKSYISTGRKIIRSIEVETLAEQPPLFREYVDARPDVKMVMDNQFRNGKANARLQSKEGWYQWRAQLVEGLKTGLEGINQGMNADLDLLQKQQHLLDDVMPKLLHEHSALQHQSASLQQSLAELDSVDHEALNHCRRQLQKADEYYLQRSALLDMLQQQINEKDEALVAAAELKTEMKDQIAEADRVREENKGWPVADVLVLKSKVKGIEEQTGWQLVTAEGAVDEHDEFGPALTMSYKGDLRLFFYPQAFQCKEASVPRRRSGRKSASTSGPTAPISLTFASSQGERENTIAERPTEKRFFLQMIRSQLHAFTMMPKGSVSPKTLLSTVSQGWDLACKVSEELRLLNLVGITTASILSDEKLGVRIILMLPGKGRVDVEFVIAATILNDGDVVSTTNVNANAIWGSALELVSGSKCRKVQQALGKEVESRTLGEGAWVSAVHGFEEWFLAQDRSKQEAKKDEEMNTAVTTTTEVSAPAQSPPPTVPAPASTSSVPKRSPLAPKRTNTVQKKALPLPKQRFDKFNAQTQSQPATEKVMEKENFNPSLSVSSSKAQRPIQQNKADVDDWADKQMPRPAITPEMQEAMMMHTPIKRVGALRRSPI